MSYYHFSENEFEKRIVQLESMLAECRLCPRNCGANRLKGEKGYCRTLLKPTISSVFPHFGEEKPLVGSGGSGTIFFSNCNLGCVYCQNFEISALGEGEEVSYDYLASAMISLQRRGCHNINFVTPTHQVYAILKALKAAVSYGLNIPLVYNCGGYEGVKTLELLDGIFDIYMPDFKYGNNETGYKYSGVEDYFDRAKVAVREMYRQTGEFQQDGQGIMQRGVLIRHLVLPGGIAESSTILKFLASEVSTQIYLNIMDQYHPAHKSKDYPELARPVTKAEYEAVVKLARDLGFKYIDG